MYLILDKDMIENEIVTYLSLPRRGFPPTVPLAEIVNAILYKLKTGCPLAPSSRGVTVTGQGHELAIGLPRSPEMERCRGMEG